MEHVAILLLEIEREMQILGIKHYSEHESRQNEIEKSTSKVAQGCYSKKKVWWGEGSAEIN